MCTCNIHVFFILMKRGEEEDVLVIWRPGRDDGQIDSETFAPNSSGSFKSLFLLPMLSRD